MGLWELMTHICVSLEPRPSTQVFSQLWQKSQLRKNLRRRPGFEVIYVSLVGKELNKDTSVLRTFCCVPNIYFRNVMK